MITRFQYNSVEEYLEKAKYYIKGADVMYANILVLPELKIKGALRKEIQIKLAECITNGLIVIIAGSIKEKTGFSRRVVILSEQTVAGHIKATHCAGIANGDDIEVIKISPYCSVAAVFDWEINIPEIARTAMLKGADILLFYDDGEDEFRTKMMKTRAAENKIFVIRSSSSKLEDCCMIINPSGGKVCTTLKSLEHSTSGYINSALSKFKNVVPGTNIVTGRSPNKYKELVL
jgi:predicted amidohydrolase